MNFCHMKYDVTIGIPVCNAEKYIRQTLSSALSQSFENIEFLIVDDCGIDSSMSIVREFQETHSRGKDIRILNQSQNMGPGAARNKIIDEAQGRFLYFLDADDLMESNTIALLMEHQCRVDADIVYGSYNKIETYKNGKILKTYQYSYTELIGEGRLAEYAWRKYGGLQTTVWNYIVKIEILRKAQIRFLDTNFWEDMAFTFDLLPYCQHAVLLPDITYHYLCHYDSLSKYQERTQISKEEVIKNISTVDYMKRQCVKTMGKSYQPQRCLNVLKTDFYVLCYILKNSHKITPSFSRQELKTIMTHPATLSEIMDFPHGRIKNLMLYWFSKLPAGMVVWIMTVIGKSKGLI